MTQRIVHGPMEFLAPDTDFNGILEISGITIPNNATPAVHVFLDEVATGDLESLKKSANYAGSFTLPDDASSIEQGKAKVLLDITQALRKAEQDKPNFHITFLSEANAPNDGGKWFKYESIHIRHTVPESMDLDLSAKVTGGLAIDHEEPI